MLLQLAQGLLPGEVTGQPGEVLLREVDSLLDPPVGRGEGGETGQDNIGPQEVLEPDMDRFHPLERGFGHVLFDGALTLVGPLVEVSLLQEGSGLFVDVEFRFGVHLKNGCGEGRADRSFDAPFDSGGLLVAESQESDLIGFHDCADSQGDAEGRNLFGGAEEGDQVVPGDWAKGFTRVREVREEPGSLKPM